MSLLSEAMEECTLLDRVTSTDGYGGIEETWKDGATFKAAVTFDTSMQARTAGVQGVTSLYTVTTAKNVNLQYHDVFRRADGKTFRITSDGKDKKTPPSASLNMRVVSAEEYVING